MSKPYATLFRRIGLQIGLILACFSLSRILFTLIYLESWPELSLFTYSKLAFLGLRFDISSLFSFNILYFLLCFLPIKALHSTKGDRLLQKWFVFSNSIAFLFELSDWAYFRYNHKRATAELLHMMGRKSDFWNLLPGFLAEYWYLLIVAILWILLFIQINNRIVRKTTLSNVRMPLLAAIAYCVLVLGASIIGIRGGIQYIPISTRNAVSHTQSQYTPIVLNTPFSVLSTLQNETLEEVHFFNQQTALQYIQPFKQYKRKPFSSKNVVFIILESFSKDFTGLSDKKSYTPFLDSLMRIGLSCTNAQANGFHSNEGIPAILSGLPSLQEDAFIQSIYATNRITSIANTLGNVGYQSAFYHGGNRGTMNFDLYARSAGFNHYIGRENYPNKQDYDGNWGIWDHAFLPFAAQDMSTRLKEPFVASVFSLSSHHPFSIPKAFEGKFPQGKINIHEAIGYTDYALRLFFQTAQQQKWFNNTLFVIVPDHCATYAEDDYHMYFQGRYAIPLIFYAPSDPQLNGQYDGLCQQIDILPSVLDQLGYQDSFFAFGNSIFSTMPQSRFAVQIWYGNLLWTMNEHLLKMANKQPEGFYNLQDSLCTKNLITEQDSLMQASLHMVRAMRQVYNHAMIHNELFIR